MIVALTENVIAERHSPSGYITVHGGGNSPQTLAHPGDQVAFSDNSKKYRALLRRESQKDGKRIVEISVFGPEEMINVNFEINESEEE